MPKQKRRTLPGALLLLVLVGSAIALGIYGNKLLTSGTGTIKTETPIETSTYTETPGTPPQSTYTNETSTTSPT
ncbi:MAG: hypothetical protein QXG17_03125 [Sulfolobales archaeon]